MSLVNLFFSTIRNFIKVNNNDLSYLKVGDIVYAKRYDTKEEMLKIPKGHREGPYVIIKQTKNNTYALQMTSKLHCENVWKHIYYPIGKLTYHTVKNSYINTTKLYELNDSKYICLFGQLKNNDLNNLYKSLYILIHSSIKTKPDLSDSDLKFKFSVGDLIKYNNQKYFIYEENKKNFICYSVSKKVKAKNRILINNTYYSFNFNTPIIIPKSKKIELLDTFNSGEITIILNNRDNILQLQKGKNNLDSGYIIVGSLIKYKENLYYVYDTNDSDYKCLLIEKTYDKNINMIFIKINGGIYYSRNSKITLNKNLDIKRRRVASKSEIEENNKIIKNKRNTNTIKCLFDFNEFYKIKNVSEEFIPMMIIKNKYTEKNYLILSKIDKVIELINIDDMKDYFYYELEDGNIPFTLYRIMDELEFANYKKKVEEFMSIVKNFDK